MGNRAVVTFDTLHDSPCIYLHWNGGRDSVEAFLKVAENLNLNPQDPMVMDKWAEILGTYFFEKEVGSSVIYRYTYGTADTDNYDNGVYVIGRDWSIQERRYMRHREQISPETTQAIYDGIMENIVKNLTKKEIH